MEVCSPAQSCGSAGRCHLQGSPGRVEAALRVPPRTVPADGLWNCWLWRDPTQWPLRGAVGLLFLSVALTSAFVSFADAHMVEYYHFMVTIMSNLIQNDS